MSKKKIKIFQNRKARFNYETIEKFETGIVLLGNEIRSIRDGKVVLDNSYAVFKKGEVWILNLYVDLKGYKKSFDNSDNVRPKKLLLKKKQIERISKMQDGTFVIFGMTPQDYENMAYNLQELRRYIRQQKEIIIYYRDATKIEQ